MTVLKVLLGLGVISQQHEISLWERHNKFKTACWLCNTDLHPFLVTLKLSTQVSCSTNEAATKANA